MLSLCKLELGISVLKNSFDSLFVSDIYVDEVSDSISLLEIWEVNILSLCKLELGISLVNDWAVVSL